MIESPKRARSATSVVRSAALALAITVTVWYASFKLLSTTQAHGPSQKARIMAGARWNTANKQQHEQERQHRPRCKHSLILSAERHGTTWLTNSIDGCKYTTGSYYIEDVFALTEPWHIFKGPLQHATVAQLTQYVRRNATVKLFPGQFARYRRRVKELIRAANKGGIEVIVLRRNATQTFVSAQRAAREGDWRRAKPSNRSEGEMEGEKARDEKSGEQLKQHTERLGRYFKSIRQMLDAHNTPYVTLHYEEIHKQEWIRAGARSRCWIHNCNFVTTTASA